MSDLERHAGETKLTAAQNLKMQLTTGEFVEQLAQVLPKAMVGTDPLREAKRMALIFWGACRNTPRLLECAPDTVLSGFMHSGEMGLIPNTPAGEAYLVPYWDKKRGCYCAQWQPGYRGLIKRGFELGLVKDVNVQLVYQNERFSYVSGKDWDILHEPALDPSTRGDLLCGYAIANLMTGGTIFDVMPARDIYAIKARSKSKRKDGTLTGPWVTDEEAMMLKTVLNRLYHRKVPMSSSLAKLVGVSTAVEAGLQDPDPYLASGEMLDPSQEKTTERTMENAQKIDDAIILGTFSIPNDDF